LQIKESISFQELGDKKFKIRLIEEANTEIEAAYTHYLYNHKNGASKFFKKDAIKYLISYVNHKYPRENFNQSAAEEALQYLLFQKEDIPYPSHDNPKFKFIDLFAGIGGFRLALHELEGKCVFTSELDKYSKQTYKANFGELPFGDITKPRTKSYIPNEFDVLCAGFPCQAFSIAGKRGGFEDTRGTLFFEVAKIIKSKEPKAIFLENIKGLRSHNRGNTLSTILNVLRNDLGYYVPEPQIINARDFGVPQNRERIFIVGFRKDLGISDFNYPEPVEEKPTLSSILEKKEVSVKYYLSETYLETLRRHRKRHESKGNGIGYEIIAGGMGRERNLKVFRFINSSSIKVA